MTKAIKNSKVPSHWTIGTSQLQCKNGKTPGGCSKLTFMATLALIIVCSIYIGQLVWA